MDSIEALKGKEKLILNTLTENEILVFYQDCDSNILWANSKAAESFDQQQGSIIGQKCYQVLRNRNSPCENCPVVKAVEKGEVSKGEITTPGERYWSVIASPVFNEEEEIIGVIETAFEITESKEKEIELRKQKELLEGIIDGVPDILTILNPDFSIEKVNKAGYKALGMSPEEVQGKKCYELQGKDEKCRDCATQKALQSKRLENIEKYNPKFDKYISCYSNPILDEEGNVIQFVEQIRDVTEEKLAKQKLEKEKQFIDSVLETQSGLVVVLDTAGKIVRFNSACERVTGYSFSEVKGKKVWDLFIIEEEQESTKEVFSELLARDFPNQNENYWRTKEGELRLISWANNVITDEEGDIEYVVATGIDITEKNQLIKELKMKNKAIQKSGTAFAFADQEGLIIEVNNAFLEMWGYESEEDVLGLNPLDLHPPKEKKRITDSLKQIRSGGTWQDELTAIKADGSKFEVYTSSTVMKDEAGEIQGMMASFIDITESKRVKEELREAKQKAEAANKAKSEFLANMSHEIRTPLNAVIGFSEILEKQIENPKYQNYLKSIKDAGNNLLKLINNILDISKIEAGHLEIKKEWLAPNIILQEMESIFAYRAEEKGLNFIQESDLFSDVDCKSSFFEIKLDETRLRQILINLIGNAIKFTDTGYIKVSIQGEEKEDSKLHLEFIVADTGIGICKSEQEMIFKAFTQRQDQSFEYEGTGLGLTICQRLAKQMGGRIELDSEVDKGSIFKVVFPEVEYKFREKNSREEKTNYDLINFNSQEVLIVDDIESNLELLKIKLENKGLRVLTANSTKQALELVKEHQPQLILLDLKMPGLDGYQAKELIEAELQKKVPIIALTAFATTTEERKVWKAGFTAFLSKPIEEQTLFAEVTKHLEYTLSEEKEEQLNISLEKDVDLENLVKVLEEDLLTKYEKIKDAIVINEVEEFAGLLAKIAADYSIDSLSNYAQELLVHAESFDLDNLKAKLSDFPFWVDKLKELNND
ncbi:PAS domain-containing hybrid sensor histidine kinase/response regulator [Fuchsiella alkaliacetigena]|uniref:PAS domain-containing hybrid sensor histidine kinase/response regulator n=1 Tax=Fuchsiella alkaliacetigena TaxID=957042 RepID=UPI00200A04CD|nr:PAS domain-containing protein [Fuchsiella alkaliacetigena]MCK8825962.1 PAS domain S-box protein [Fuchsiella alkaliacetigena]